MRRRDTAVLGGPLVAVFVVVLLLLGLCVGCSDDPDATDDLSDDDVQMVPVNRADLQPVTYGNYEGFPNVVAWCDGNTRVFTTTRTGGAALRVVPDHPLCEG